MIAVYLEVKVLQAVLSCQNLFKQRSVYIIKQLKLFVPAAENDQFYHTILHIFTHYMTTFLNQTS